jgi:AcrR family transcriptional regulator
MPNFTKKAIKEVFVQLLNDKPLAQITVKDIAAECGINRNSFYYHFEDMPSLIEEIMREQVEEIICKNQPAVSMEECFNVAMESARSSKRAIFHIYNSISRDVFEQYLMKGCNYAVELYIAKMFGDLEIDEEKKQDIIRFYKWLAFGAISEWLESGMEGDMSSSIRNYCQLANGLTEIMIQRSIE